jgi:hypothetical protein
MIGKWLKDYSDEFQTQHFVLKYTKQYAIPIKK